MTTSEEQLDLQGWLLDPEDFETLTPEDQQVYLHLLDAELRKWSLDKTPRAKLAHLLAHKVDWLLCGGAAGGGKSEALAYHAWELDRNIAGHHSLVLRTSLPELRRSFILRTIVRFAQTGDDKRAKYANKDNVKAWWWDNGSITEFGYCNRDDDVGQFLSAEYDLVCFDESTQFSPYMLTMILGRLRTTTDKAARGARPHAILATNPGDRSHEWHKDLFVDPTEEGRYIVVYDISDGMTTDDGQIDWERCKIVNRIPCPQTEKELADLHIESDPEKHLVIAFVPFRSTDNPFLDPSVRKGLNALPETERRQKRDGDWTAFTGRFFTSFERDIHIIDPFEVPDSWDHRIALDHGHAAPFACVFGAWDSDGNCYIYDECYEARLTPQEQAAKVLTKLQFVNDKGRVQQRRLRRSVADPAVFGTKGEGRSIAVQWADAGLRVEPASNPRIDGWANVREYLHRPLVTDALGNETRGQPKLFIFSSCRNLIRELANVRQDAHRPEDVDTRGDDHAIDALRYLLMTRPRRIRKQSGPNGVPLVGLEAVRAKHLEKARRVTASQLRRMGITE